MPILFFCANRSTIKLQFHSAVNRFQSVMDIAVPVELLPELIMSINFKCTCIRVCHKLEEIGNNANIGI